MANQKERDQALMSIGSKVEVCSPEEGFMDALFPAVVVNPPSFSRSSSGKRKKRYSKLCVKVQYQNLVNDDGKKPLVENVDLGFIRPPPPPHDPDQSFELYEVVDAFHQDIWWTGVISRIVDDEYTVVFKNPPDVLIFNRSELRPHWDWDQEKWVRPEKQEVQIPLDREALSMLACNTVANVENETATPNVSPGVAFNKAEEQTICFSNVHDKKELSANKEKVNNISSGDQLAETVVEKSKQKECQEQETQETFPSKKRGRPLKSKSPPTVPLPKTYKRGRRGRPSKLETKNPQFSDEGGQAMNIADANFLSNAMNIADAELLLSMSLQSEGLMGTHAENSCCLRMETDVGVSSGIEKGKHPGVVVANSQAVSAATGEELNRGGDASPDCTTEKSKSVAIFLEKSIGSKDAVNDGKASALATGFLTKEVGAVVTSDAQLVETHQSENAGDPGDVDLEGSLCLPFVKSSPFWEAIESGEVLRKFPQNPHFQPLTKSAEVLREGLALGHMMCFVSLVEKTCKLKVDDPREHYDSIMRTLDELEELGFDVKAVRDPLCVKLQKKAKLEKFIDQLKEVEVQIGEFTDVETKINDKMKSLEKEKKKLAEEEKRLEEEEATVMFKRENTRSEIRCLRSRADVINEGISSILQDLTDQ